MKMFDNRSIQRLIESINRGVRSALLSLIVYDTYGTLRHLAVCARRDHELDRD